MITGHDISLWREGEREGGRKEGREGEREGGGREGREREREGGRERGKEGERERERDSRERANRKEVNANCLIWQSYDKNKSAKHKLGNNNNYHIIMTHTAKSYSIIIIKY